MDDCAICHHLGLAVRPATGSMGLLTSIPAILAAASELLPGNGGAAAHVIVPTCPEHAVDVYRDRVAGVTIAWKLATPQQDLALQSREAGSASPA